MKLMVIIQTGSDLWKKNPYKPDWKIKSQVIQWTER